MANNRKNVTLEDYASCVLSQVDFLVTYDGRDVLMPVLVAGVPTPHVRECYERNVSVDACATSVTI